MDVYIDNSDFMPDPSTHFMGYKCPHFFCDLIMVSHDSCLAMRLRLNSIGNKLIVSDKEFIDMFQFNWNQFCIKLQSRIIGE